MTEPTQITPAPTAVPWTPDMMTQAVPTTAMAPPPSPAPLAHMPAQPTQAHAMPAQMPPQAQPMYQPAHQPMAAQPVPLQPIYAPQSAPPQAPQQPFQRQQPAHAPHNPQHIAQPQMSQHAPYQQPAMQQQPPQHVPQAQMAPPPPAPRYQQSTMPPPLAPHMQQAAQPDLAPAESKSLIGKLLKRSPKPLHSEQVLDVKPSSGSLFNKNFVLGAVAGLLVGAFALPMVQDLISPKATSQYQAQAASQPLAQAQPLPGFDPNAPLDEGEDTFLDAALSSDNP